MEQSPFLNETLHLSALLQRPLSLPEMPSESTPPLVQSYSSFQVREILPLHEASTPGLPTRPE